MRILRPGGRRGQREGGGREGGRCPRPGQLSADVKARPGWDLGGSGRKKDLELTVSIQGIISDDKGRGEGYSQRHR